MTPAITLSAAQIRATYAHILPRAEDKIVMCEQLLRSIGYCESIGSTAWSVSLLDRGFRLNVGQVEVLTCLYSFWDRMEFAATHDTGFLDFRFLVSGPDAKSLTERIYPDVVQRMDYRSVSEEHWVIQVTLIVEGETSAGDRAEAIKLINDLQLAHRNFVARAAHTSAGSLRKRSKFTRFNCDALIAYAREEIGAVSLGTPDCFVYPIPAARNCDLVHA